jgi:ureidoglycolate lyase
MVDLLPVRPLARELFLDFGEVLDASGRPDDIANGGAAQVFRDRAEGDFQADGGRLRFNVVRTATRSLPLDVEMMERHPLSSQLFSPLGGVDWLVIVAPAGPLNPREIVAFRARADQAVSYRRGVWHHPLVALAGAADFLVIDRAGPGDNLDIERLAAPLRIEAVS